MEKKCCICESIFEGYGNNALPIKGGTCCDKCNETFVFPARLYSSPNNFITYAVCSTREAYLAASKALTKKNFYHTGTIYAMSSFHNDENEEDVILVPSYINHKE